MTSRVIFFFSDQLSYKSTLVCYLVDVHFDISTSRSAAATVAGGALVRGPEVVHRHGGGRRRREPRAHGGQSQARPGLLLPGPSEISQFFSVSERLVRGSPILDVNIDCAPEIALQGLQIVDFSLAAQPARRRRGQAQAF